jgi:hypothetical protein
MSLPNTVNLSYGGAFVVSSTESGRVLITCPEWASMTAAEAEELADALWLAASDGRPKRAKAITSVDDERVKGAP